MAALPVAARSPIWCRLEAYGLVWKLPSLQLASFWLTGPGLVLLALRVLNYGCKELGEVRMAFEFGGRRYLSRPNRCRAGHAASPGRNCGQPGLRVRVLFLPAAFVE